MAQAEPWGLCEQSKEQRQGVREAQSPLFPERRAQAKASRTVGEPAGCKGLRRPSGACRWLRSHPGPGQGPLSAVPRSLEHHLRGQGGGPGAGGRAPPASEGVGVTLALGWALGGARGSQTPALSSSQRALGICSSQCARPDSQTKYLVSRADGLEMQILLLCFQQTVTHRLSEP